jgi:hypothetical protein
MTEVKAEGNILNSEKYPDIKDNTINLAIPCHTDEEEKQTIDSFKSVCNIDQFNQFRIKHHLNGYFTVFQQKL